MKIYYANVLRALATIAVVAIHVSASLLYSLDHPLGWWTGNIVDSFSRWSVPIFVMISGMLLLAPRREESIPTFMKKRASKIIIPFLFWTLVYILWKNKYALGAVDLTATAKDILQGNVYVHLWFLYMIIGLYLITPVIRLITKKENMNVLVYYVAIWFLVSAFYGIFRYYLGVNIAVRVEPFIGYLGYFILGYVLANLELNARMKRIIYMLGILSMFVTVFGTYAASQWRGEFDGYFYEYLSPNTIFVSAALFLWMKNIKWEKFITTSPKMYNLIEKVSDASFGVYLVHLLVIGILGWGPFENVIGFIGPDAALNPIIGLPLNILIVFLVSYVITIIMKKIPGVNKLVP